MIYEKVVEKIISRFTDYDEEDISAETAFEDIHANEEDIIDMAFEISCEMNIIIDEEDLYGVEDVGDLVHVIEQVSKE